MPDPAEFNAHVSVRESFAGGKVEVTNGDGKSVRFSVSPGMAAEVRRLFGIDE